MEKLRHLFPVDAGTNFDYIYTRKVRTEFSSPPRDDRVGHGEALARQVEEASATVFPVSQPEPAEAPQGVVLTFQSSPSFKLKLTSLEAVSYGIEIRNTRIVDDVMQATVFVPRSKLSYFIGKFKKFAYEDTQNGKPKNHDLATSINQIELSALGDFWTDAGSLPEDQEQQQWWELWLQDSSTVNVLEEFRQRIPTGVLISQNVLRFPERIVVLVKASIDQLLQIPNIFDFLAELRSAKFLSSEFTTMTPRVQAQFVEMLRGLVQPPPPNSPAVCHLDTGINRAHPLLEFAVPPDHCLAVDATWDVSDRHPQQHGTAMAGIALYGDLLECFQRAEPVQLGHRLQSVKLLHNLQPNDPDLYGELTNQAISRIEISDPALEQRAFALTITADGRDEGIPSSWSAALDQVIAAAGGETTANPRLIFVSAGNTPADDRESYPENIKSYGVEDPGQSWNAVTVGAYTEKVAVREADYTTWKVIASKGQLSPASRTSQVWYDKSWAIKPDFVMEGGNYAINPTNGKADALDDLMLLTTQLDNVSGSQLTVTGDTSAATALAARAAAIIWQQYPELWPETVRALLVHSARWTDQMQRDYPARARHNRLRTYGYGVPNIEQAIWSARHHATMILQDALQPFKKEGPDVKTKDFKLYQLPWPKQVLERLGEMAIRLRITLSYFIEPSPGRRGWDKKHRYQSHGLRFDVMRPTDVTIDEFKKRISKSAWDEDDVEEGIDFGSEERKWEIGTKLRTHGSIHSDVWSGTAAELSASGAIAVFPVTGWWRERKHLSRWGELARYSLIVSLESDNSEIDLYTPILNQIQTPVPVAVPISSGQ